MYVDLYERASIVNRHSLGLLVDKRADKLTELTEQMTQIDPASPGGAGQI